MQMPETPYTTKLEWLSISLSQHPGDKTDESVVADDVDDF